MILFTPEKAIGAVADFTAGVVLQVAHDNAMAPQFRDNLAPHPSESTVTTAGRIVGGLVSTAQGFAEMFGGASLMTGGTTACLSGVGCIAGSLVAVGGAAVVVHGGVVGTSGVIGIVENTSTIISNISGSGSGGSSWQFQNTRKENQAQRRGWGNSDIQDVLDRAVETKSTINQATNNSATVYYRADGHYVVKDNITNDIFHFSDTNDPNWIDPFGDVIIPRGN